ncbi:MAG TPA: type IV toxin-antitoxin system AbiEi family antitoxin [bacterium]
MASSETVLTRPSLGITGEEIVSTTSARRIPASLAPVVEELELEQPKVVTKAFLDKVLSARGIGLNPISVANRLQKHGWLLSLKTKGTWEFAPASRAGAINSGDRFIELRATLLRNRAIPAAIAYESAAWLHGLVRRTPQRDVLAIRPGTRIPPALRDYRITRQWGRLDPVVKDELPVWCIETLLVLMAKHPMAYKAWPNVMDWLPDAARQVSAELVIAELADQRKGGWARVGYMLEIAGRPDLADRLFEKVQPLGDGPFYFGPRNSNAKYSKRWHLLDSIVETGTAR